MQTYALLLIRGHISWLTWQWLSTLRCQGLRDLQVHTSPSSDKAGYPYLCLPFALYTYAQEKILPCVLVHVESQSLDAELWDIIYYLVERRSKSEKQIQILSLPFKMKKLWARRISGAAGRQQNGKNFFKQQSKTQAATSFIFIIIKNINIFISINFKKKCS